MEEDTTPPRRNHNLLLGGMRFTKPQGHMEEPPVRPRHSTRSSAPPPYALRYSDGFIIMTEEEEKKVARLERLVANVDFDDQALHIFGFHTNIYYMLGHLDYMKQGKYISGDERGGFKVAKVNLPLPDGRLDFFL
jgi:hypothetical protein